MLIKSYVILAFVCTAFFFLNKINKISNLVIVQINVEK